MSRNLPEMTVEAALSRWPFVEQQLVENGFKDIADKPEARLSDMLDPGQLAILDDFIGVMEDFLGTSDDKVREVTVLGGRAKDGGEEMIANGGKRGMGHALL